MTRALAMLMIVVLVGLRAGSARADEIDDYVNSQMKALRMAGLSLAVVEAGGLVKAQGYGLANVELGVPATPETVYEIASLTKAFTAWAILFLVEERKVRLDGKAGDYLSDLPSRWRSVSVRQLLNHTSGIRNYQEAEGYSVLGNYKREDLIRLASSLPAGRPGERWLYSNTNYVLLGRIVEKASGTPYEQFLDARIFRPLGMSATRLNDHRATIAHRASGYGWGEGGWANVPRQTIATPAGGLVSTVVDLAKWDSALRSNQLLAPATAAAAWTPGTLDDGTRTPYGFGWFVSTMDRRRVVEHTGNTPGFSAAIVRHLDGETTAIVLSNTEGKSLQRIARRVARMSTEQSKSLKRAAQR